MIIDLSDLLGAISGAEARYCNNPDCPACNARRMMAAAGGKVAQA